MSMVLLRSRIGHVSSIIDTFPLARFIQAIFWLD